MTAKSNPVASKAVSAEEHWRQAVSLAQSGSLAEALKAIDRAIAERPDMAPIWADRGGMQQLAGLHDEAEASLRQALALDAGQACAHHNLGLLLQSRRALAEARRHFEAAVAAGPDRAEYRQSLGGALFGLRDYAGAEAAYRNGLRLAPADAPLRYNLATALLKQFRFEEAAEELRRVTRDAPAFFEAWNNLGNVLRDLEGHEEALAAHLRAIELRPDDAGAYANAGFDLRRIEHYDEAEQCYRRAIALQADHDKAHFNLAICRLLRGDFAEGFREYRWREGGRVQAAPAEGALAGKRVLLVRDQGIGDELFFLRFAPLLKARGARLACQCSPKLASLLQRWPVLETVAERETPADLAVSLGDLPAWFSDAVAPALLPPVPLVPLPERMEKARRALAAVGDPPYAALTWRAGTPLARQIGRGQRALTKEVGSEDLARFLPEGTLVSLQRLPLDGEVAALAQRMGRPVHDFSTWNEDLEDMLALLAGIDDYVTVSNTNVHLLAGLGRTATVLVPFPPEWRWMASGEASPWFPGFRIVRQDRHGRWGEGETVE